MKWLNRRKGHEEREATVSGAVGSAPEPSDGAVDYLADSPIEESDDDRFGRSPWAGRVAETIAAQRDASSLVVGIYGPWGDGKTSALNLIHKKLEVTEGVVPVRFNPWRLGDEAEMFQASSRRSQTRLTSNCHQRRNASGRRCATTAGCSSQCRWSEAS